MESHATSPFFFWRRNTPNVLQMEGKMADSGVQQPMITKVTKSGASVKVSMEAILRHFVLGCMASVCGIIWMGILELIVVCSLACKLQSFAVWP